jgi:hypothetical protein
MARHPTTWQPDFGPLGRLTYAQRYAIGYMARRGTMFGKPAMMELLRERGLVEPCGTCGLLTQWRLTPAGRELKKYFL